MRSLIKLTAAGVLCLGLGACDKESDAKNKKYNCVDGACVEKSDGFYDSKSICEQACGGGSAGTLTDIDGNVYELVQIGNQIWMAENLKVKQYNDGTPIQEIANNTQWWNLPANEGAWCAYDNDAQLADLYGHLYNWGAVNSGKLCPSGWHIPTSTEWEVLFDFLGGESVAGGKMKTTTGWFAPNTGATNESGFNGLPGGIRWYSSGVFTELNESASWWTASPNNRNGYFDKVTLYNWSVAVDHFYTRPQMGQSCRCIKD
jgi:uncharacterized protein (TIGR02145 family)